MSFYSDTPIMFGGISGTTATRGKDPEPGTRVNYAGREFVYIYNAGGTAVAPGKLVVAATGTAGYSCTVSAATYGIPVGVCVHATIAAASYGWVCYRGTCEVAIPSACAQGTVIAVNTNGVFATYICGTTGKEVGYMVSASSGSTALATAYISF